MPRDGLIYPAELFSPANSFFIRRFHPQAVAVIALQDSGDQVAGLLVGEERFGFLCGFVDGDEAADILRPTSRLRQAEFALVVREIDAERLTGVCPF